MAASFPWRFGQARSRQIVVVVADTITLRNAATESAKANVRSLRQAFCLRSSSCYRAIILLDKKDHVHTRHTVYKVEWVQKVFVDRCIFRNIERKIWNVKANKKTPRWEITLKFGK